MRRRSWVGLVAAALTVAAGGWLGAPRPEPARLLSGGMVFLESGAGVVGVVDAVTGVELAVVGVGGAGDDFFVVGGWRDGFGVDPAAGRVVRVDGRLLGAVGEVSATRPDDRLMVVPGRDAVFVVRPSARLVEVVDAASGRVVVVPVAALEDAAIAGPDALWVMAEDRVGMVSADGELQRGAAAGLGEGAVLVAAGGRPVVVGARGAAMVAFDPRSLDARDVVSGPGVGGSAVGTETGWVVAVDPASSAVAGIELDGDPVPRSFLLPGVAEVGVPVSSEGLVYVAGTVADGSAAVWVIDPGSDVVVTSPLAGRRGIVELTVQQGRVWWTDGTVAGRGSIGSDGAVSTIDPVQNGEEVLQCTYVGDPVARASLQFAVSRQDDQPIAEVRWAFGGDVEGPATSDERSPIVSWASSGPKRITITSGTLTTVCSITLGVASETPPTTTRPTAISSLPPVTGTTSTLASDVPIATNRPLTPPTTRPRDGAAQPTPSRPPTTTSRPTATASAPTTTEELTTTTDSTTTTTTTTVAPPRTFALDLQQTGFSELGLTLRPQLSANPALRADELDRVRFHLVAPYPPCEEAYDRMEQGHPAEFVVITWVEDYLHMRCDGSVSATLDGAQVAEASYTFTTPFRGVPYVIGMGVAEAQAAVRARDLVPEIGAAGALPPGDPRINTVASVRTNCTGRCRIGATVILNVYEAQLPPSTAPTVPTTAPSVPGT